MSVSTSTVTVHGLVCHRDVDMALVCLGSLLKFSVQPLHLVIHDDGSLTPKDVEKLLNNLTGSSIIFRHEADELLNQLLKQYPNCYNYRYKNVLSLKLLDVPLLSQSDFAFCDSDILFMQPFEAMFRWFNDNTSALFMKDYVDAYSMLPWHLLGNNKLKLPAKVNSGLIFFRKAAYDLDFVEWFLGQEQFRHKIGWLEQTCWAALGHRVGCQQWNAEQITLIRPNTSLSNNLVAGHFVKEVRYRLGEFASATEALTATKSPVLVETITPPDCNLLELAQLHGMRQLKRVRNYHKIPSIVGKKFFGSYQQVS